MKYRIDINEAVTLRIKDLRLEEGAIMIRGGKGDKDRTTILPTALIPELLGHADISTTEIYLHCLPSDMDRIGSPWDTPAPVREQPQAPTGIIPFRASA
jgi:site-specific recombinase XerD